LIGLDRAEEKAPGGGRGRKRKAAALSTTDKIERTYAGCVAALSLPYLTVSAPVHSRARKAEVARECRKRKKNYIQTLEQKVWQADWLRSSLRIEADTRTAAQISELQSRLSEAESKALANGVKAKAKAPAPAAATDSDVTHVQEQTEMKKRMREVLTDLAHDSPKGPKGHSPAAALGAGALPKAGGAGDGFSLSAVAVAAAAEQDGSDDDSFDSEDQDNDEYEAKGGRSADSNGPAKRRKLKASEQHTHAGQSVGRQACCVLSAQSSPCPIRLLRRLASWSWPSC
jgi:hypothetical protein